MPEPRFCGACGGPLQDGDGFCTTCGSPVTTQEAPQPAPAAASANGEQILAVIGNLTLVGGFMGLKQKAYTLVITDRRLIFAELTKEKIAAMVNAARDDAKASGKGFFGQWGAQLKSSMSYHDVYWQLSPDAALAETSGNWAIERSQYQGAKFRMGVSDEDTNTPDVLTIKAASGKYKFNVQGSLSALKKTFREVGLA
ncbi:MAG: zinc ribbon domain-containing protein [Coriobacteriia bacterium]|nr:zinc ribbon domain-containing protein [Coriobacteriia bacterium]